MQTFRNTGANTVFLSFHREELDEIEKKELEKAEKRAEIQENNVLTEDVPVETSGTQAVQTEDASENTGRKKDSYLYHVHLSKLWCTDRHR